MESKFYLDPVFYSKESSGAEKISNRPRHLTKTFNLDLKSLTEYFAFGEIWDGRTMFSDVWRRYPEPGLFRYHPDYRHNLQWFGIQLARTLQSAVERRLDENKEYGITLSGGLDSRSVLSAIPAEKRENVVAFTFGKEGTDEVRIAKKVAKYLGVREHVIIPVTPEMVVEYAPHEMENTDGMCYCGVSFSTPAAKLMRQHVDVIFDGCALDLTLGGSYLNSKKFRAIDCMEFPRMQLFNEQELKKLMPGVKFPALKNVISNEGRKYISNGKIPDIYDEFSFYTRVLWGEVGDISVLDHVKVLHPTMDHDFLDVVLSVPAELRYQHRAHRAMCLHLDRGLSRIPYNKTMLPVKFPIWLWNIGSKFELGKYFIKKKMGLSDNRYYVDFYGWFFKNKPFREFIREWICEYEDPFINQEYIQAIYYQTEKNKVDNLLRLLYIISFRLFLNSLSKKDVQIQTNSV